MREVKRVHQNPQMKQAYIISLTEHTCVGYCAVSLLLHIILLTHKVHCNLPNDMDAPLCTEVLAAVRDPIDVTVLAG